LVRRIAVCRPRGMRRGIDAARDLIRRTAHFIATIPKGLSKLVEVRKERSYERDFER
jgi:hypothetical protein